ncbi:MAG: FAD-dependent oxidoreductase [Xanthomonadales bacterium]|nr:FAD-dependent oxidoreductase [Xanthomonadales bacterium]
MRIAIVGSGIAGLASAWLLSREHEVVLFEADDRLGGHTDTHEVEQAGQRYRVDSGFIVCNPQNYPLFCAMLDELGVATQPTTMSFAVRNDRSGLEYNAGTNGGLFLQKRRLLSWRHWCMIRDILRFYREAPALLRGDDAGPDLGDYLAEHRYSASFADDHLIPMASALWSSPSEQILKFPARYLVAFMANHHMLQVENRPEWRVVRGGSSSYIGRLRETWRADVRLGAGVSAITRDDHGVRLRVGSDVLRFDQVVLACHSDQALQALADPSDAERDILGAIRFQHNDTVLHTDRSQLPRDRRAWAAWNALISAEPESECTVSYCMNLLQSIESPDPFVVTLNRTHAIDPAKILARRSYAHPIYTRESVAAQSRRAEISGQRNTWYCGAYWGWGFHEDGMRSAVDVAQGLGARWTPQRHNIGQAA